MFIINVFL